MMKLGKYKTACGGYLTISARVHSCLVSCDHIPRRSMALFRAKAVLDELIGGLPPRSSHRLQHIA